MPDIAPYAHYIERHPGPFGDELCLRGSRITVEEVVRMHLLNESSLPWIADNFKLSLAQLHAALLYYYENRDFIDHRLAAYTPADGSSVDDHLALLKNRLAAKA
jgi:uncharacterized protein (DUF433 family)